MQPVELDEPYDHKTRPKSVLDVKYIMGPMSISSQESPNYLRFGGAAVWHWRFRTVKQIFINS